MYIYIYIWARGRPPRVWGARAVRATAAAERPPAEGLGRPHREGHPRRRRGARGRRGGGGEWVLCLVLSTMSSSNIKRKRQ